MKETFSDMVWSCRLKNSQQQRKIAFLFEHKSYKPTYPHFQINDYQRNSWKMEIEAGQKPVPTDHNLKPEAMSIFEEIIEEGIIIGEERGEERGKMLGIYLEKKRIVIVLYKKRRSLKSIAEFVDFPIEEVKKIIAEHLKQQQQQQSN